MQTNSAETAPNGLDIFVSLLPGEDSMAKGLYCNLVSVDHPV
jgi:hypothetical protein